MRTTGCFAGAFLSVVALSQVVADPGWASQALPPGTPRDLRAVAALDAATVVVVGGSGTILRTTDGGATWARVASPSGGVTVPVGNAGPAGDNVPGLDQINLRLTAGLKGNHHQRLVVAVHGASSKPAFVEVR